MPGNKVDMDKLPNTGLKELAKERPDVVKRMGFKHGGMACPHREDGVLGYGNVVDGKGTKFSGVF